MTKFESLLIEIKCALTAQARQTLSAEEAAEYLGISRSKLWEMVGAYQIPFIPYRSEKKRGRVVFRKVALDEWLKSHEIRSAEDERRQLDGRRKEAA